MTALEYIKNLTHTLKPHQREELAKYLEKPNGKPLEKKTASLRGSWKINFSKDFDLHSTLCEIREEWKKELDGDL